jgi:ABC-type transport system involved in multi-copper enzyme maturation permease subunit
VRALLALFVRSLKEDVRGKSTYIVRAALVMLVLFFLWITQTNPNWSGAVGRAFFSTVVWIDLFVLSVVGLTYFASAITEEKENETLGLLRMTNLDALSILMGKSTSRLVGALFILAAQLPFMLVAVTMGGLAVRQVLAGFVCLLGYVFLIANVGLFCSVVVKRSSSATMLSGAIIVVLLILPWMLYGPGHLADGTPVEAWLSAWANATPFVRLKHVLLTGFSDSIFDWQLAVSLAVGVLFFGMAWAMFDRFADSTDEKLPLGLVAPVSNELTPTRALAGRAETPAIRWKDYHYVAGGDMAVVLKGVAVVVIMALCLPAMRWDVSPRYIDFGAMTTFFTSLFLAFCLALDASRIFKRERENRTLSSLLVLPLSTSRIVWEKTIGCLKSSWPAIAGVLISLSILAFGFGLEISREVARGSSSSARDLFYTVCVVGYVAFTVLLLPVFIAWLSLRMRWGSLPIGITIWFLGNFGMGTILVLLTQEGAMILLPIFSFCMLFGFWVAIPPKLEQLAAEE